MFTLDPANSLLRKYKNLEKPEERVNIFKKIPNRHQRDNLNMS